MMKMRILKQALVGGLILVTFSCSNPKSNDKKEPVELDYRTEIRLKQYKIQGRKLYSLHCSNCHQNEGQGLGVLYPPLENSDYLLEDIPRAVCNIKNGLKGKVKVNGQVYNQEMPANNLTDLQIAEIITYILAEFNDTTVIITQHDVRKYLENCDE